MVVPLTSQPAIGLPPHELVELYRQMLIIRRTEEQLARAHQQGLVHGACHTYVGEEAIAVGVCAHLRPDDTIFSTHRGRIIGTRDWSLARPRWQHARVCTPGRHARH